MEKMDFSQRRKSGINLPASMSESSLRLDAISPGSSVRSAANLPSPLTMSPRTLSNLSSPSSKSGSCSDRFIPCRSSSRLHTFGFVEKASPVKEGGNEAYSRLLKSELFGADFGFSSPQVCGLKWSHDDRELASGGNDNQLLVWNQHSQQPILKLTEHTAAVKAIAWSPHQSSLLASGGGTADRCIRFLYDCFHCIPPGL